MLATRSKRPSAQDTLADKVLEVLSGQMVAMTTAELAQAIPDAPGRTRISRALGQLQGKSLVDSRPSGRGSEKEWHTVEES